MSWTGSTIDVHIVSLGCTATSYVYNLQDYMAAPIIHLASRLAFYPSPDTELRSYQRVILYAEPSILRQL